MSETPVKRDASALRTIQQRLKVPKSAYNLFGKYNYRSTEAILEALKPLLAETNSWITFSDEIVEIAGQLFLKTTLILESEEDDYQYTTVAFAAHSLQQSGMQLGQITGSTSSYARKYALSGLFLLDDSKDDDVTNKHEKKPQPEKTEVQSPVRPGDTPPVQNSNEKEKPLLPWLNNGTKEFAQAIIDLKSGKTMDDLLKVYRISTATKAKLK
jgi:hypothetical protein